MNVYWDLTLHLVLFKILVWWTHVIHTTNIGSKCDYRWRNKGTGRKSHFPKVIQQKSGRAGIWTKAIWLQSLDTRPIKYWMNEWAILCTDTSQDVPPTDIIVTSPNCWASTHCSPIHACQLNFLLLFLFPNPQANLHCPFTLPHFHLSLNLV